MYIEVIVRDIGLPEASAKFNLQQGQTVELDNPTDRAAQAAHVMRYVNEIGRKFVDFIEHHEVDEPAQPCEYPTQSAGMQ